MNNSTPFQNLYNLVDNVLASYITDSATSIITFINPIFTSLLIIWIAIWGLFLMLGKSQEPLSEGVGKVIKIGFIVTLGLTIGTYNSLVVDFIQGFPEEIAGYLSGSSGTSADNLDQLFSKVYYIAEKAWISGGILNGNFGMYIIAIVIMIAGGILVLTIGSLILLSKMATAVLLGVGPIFIIMLLFKSTERFFESWLGMLINFALILILATSLGAIAIKIGDSFISTASSGTPTLGDAVTMAIIFAFVTIVMKQVQGMASALGGGIALATNGAISNMMGKAAKASPANIKRAGRNLSRNYSAARAPDRAIMRSGGRVVAAYQKKFGKGNSISS